MYGSAPVERRRMAASAEDASQGSRRRLVTGSAWFLIALGCIALAVVEHQRGKRQELAVSCFEEGEEGEPGLPPCRPSVGPLYDDSRDIYTFGGEARDSFLPKASIDKYRQPGDVEGDEPGNYAEDSMYNLYGLLTSDRTRPFFDHARFLQPGDVAEDAPPLHHRYGIFTLDGLLRDNNYDLTTGETTRGACCKCIPGAPGYDSSEITSTNPFAWLGGDDFVPGASEGGGGIDEVKDGVQKDGKAETEGEKKEEAKGEEIEEGRTDDGIPVVMAIPIEEAQPMSSVQGTPSKRRLLSIRAARASFTTLAAIQKIIQEGSKSFTMVAIPAGAKSGDMLKAHGLDGKPFAFVTPDNVPADGIIKVELPSIQSESSPESVSSSSGAETPSENATVTTNSSEGVSEPAENGTVSEGDSTAGDKTTMEGDIAAAAAGGEKKEEEENVRTASQGAGSEVTQEGVHIGLGGGLSPPRASNEEACCMCPLFDPQSGRILGWTHDPAAHPSLDAHKYIEFKHAVLERHRRIEAALGMHIYPATFLNEGVDESEEPSQESWEAGEEASEADESPQEGDGNATTAQETQGQNSSEAPNATDAEPVASVESDGNSTGAEAASVEEEAGAGGNGTAAAFSRFRQRLAAKAAQTRARNTLPVQTLTKPSHDQNKIVQAYAKPAQKRTFVQHASQSTMPRANQAPKQQPVSARPGPDKRASTAATSTVQQRVASKERVQIVPQGKSQIPRAYAHSVSQQPQQGNVPQAYAQPVRVEQHQPETQQEQQQPSMPQAYAQTVRAEQHQPETRQQQQQPSMPQAYAQPVVAQRAQQPAVQQQQQQQDIRQAYAQPVSGGQQPNLPQAYAQPVGQQQSAVGQHPGMAPV